MIFAQYEALCILIFLPAFVPEYYITHENGCMVKREYCSLKPLLRPDLKHLPINVHFAYIANDEDSFMKFLLF